MDTFLERHNLSILTQEQLDNMNSPIPILKMNLYLDIFQIRNFRSRWFQLPNTQEIMPIVYKPFQKKENEIHFL